jgi:hypothetical protein
MTGSSLPDYLGEPCDGNHCAKRFAQFQNSAKFPKFLHWENAYCKRPQTLVKPYITRKKPRISSCFAFGVEGHGILEVTGSTPVGSTFLNYLPVQIGASQATGSAAFAFGASPPPAFHTRTKKYLLVESSMVGVQVTE